MFCCSSLGRTIAWGMEGGGRRSYLRLRHCPRHPARLQALPQICPRFLRRTQCMAQRSPKQNAGPWAKGGSPQEAWREFHCLGNKTWFLFFSCCIFLSVLSFPVPREGGLCFKVVLQGSYPPLRFRPGGKISIPKPSYACFIEIILREDHSRWT